ncbi:MAG TPA: DUF4157 domain-containing protein [Gemmatimonadaceae bacterium]
MPRPDDPRRHALRAAWAMAQVQRRSATAADSSAWPAPATKLEIGPSHDPLEHEADQVADQIMTGQAVKTAVTPAPAGHGQRMCAGCEEEQAEQGNLQRRDAGGAAPSAEGGVAPPIVHEALGSAGQPLDPGARTFLESRLGADFSDVRVHADPLGAASAQAIGALAYTVGRDIVFAEGKYAPSTPDGMRLLAHEATHVVQQSDSAGGGAMRLQRACPSDWQTTVNDDHNRALGMVSVAIAKLGSYDGTNPPEVRTALATHFHGTSTALAGWVRFNLRYLRLVAPLASYKCSETGTGMCGPTTNAWAMWCVPFTDIRVCNPNYFGRGDIAQSTTLIHEWVHRYGCNFDLGYEGSDEYSGGGTGRALFNADPWAKLVRDVQ